MPFLGSAVCGVLHFLTLRSRRASGDADDPRLGALVQRVACGVMGLAFILALRGFFALTGDHGHHAPALTSGSWDWIDTGSFQVGVAMVLDRLSSVMTLVITGVGLLIHVYAASYMRGDRGYAKFFAYLNLFVGMMLILVLSSNLVGLFVGWEGVGLCSYLLIGFWYLKGWPAEAAQKAFIVNRIGDASFLLGMFLLVQLFSGLELPGGPLDMAALGAAVETMLATEGNGLLLSVACLLLFGGACGKSAQIPLFVWLPDAMAGPTPVSALIHAATMVTAGVYMIVRLSPLFAACPEVLFFIGTVGAVTALVAGSTALVQRDLKKVLAYSTVSQLGYMFLALGSGAWVAAIFHLVTHAFFKALLFLGAGSVIHGMHEEQDMHRMGGLKAHMPHTFKVFVIGAAALSGLPLLSGFFSKDEILALTFARGGSYYLLWGIGIVTAAMTAYYSWRMVGLTFFGKERFDVESVHPHESPAMMTGPLYVLAFLSIVGGLFGLPHVFHLGHALHAWLEPVTHSADAILAAQIGASDGHMPHLSARVEWILLGLGSVIALSMAHKGFHGHRQGTGGDESFQNSQPGLARLFGSAWGVDRAYQLAIVQPIKIGAFLIAVVVDQFAIDGAVNQSAAMARGAGRKLRCMANGSIPSYGLWMGGVAAAICLLWMFSGGVR